jgi:transposase
MTERLSKALERIALATSGEQGARLAALLHMPSSPTTLLRRVMDLPAPASSDVETVGIDDWALRRGRLYGTVLVDLETHNVIDLLPERTAASAEAWFRTHPEISIVSRNRGGEYAAAARSGAPQAIQVADRFHLVKNLTEATELVLARCRPQLRHLASATTQTPASTDTEAPTPPASSTPVCIEEWRPRPHPSTVKKTQARRTQRLDRYTQAVELRAQGHMLADIARQIGRSERTVRSWLQSGSYPEIRCPKRRSIFDPYTRYILQRWAEGTRNSQQLFTEIGTQGYSGTLRTLQRFLAQLQERPVASPPGPPVDDPLQRLSQGCGLVVHAPAERNGRVADFLAWPPACRACESPLSCCGGWLRSSASSRRSWRRQTTTAPSTCGQRRPDLHRRQLQGPPRAGLQPALAQGGPD